MAPERPKTLPVLDYSRAKGGGFQLHVDRWDPEDGKTELVVTWAAQGQPDLNWYRAGDGAVWILAPPGYRWSAYDAEVSSPEPGLLAWADATGPGGYLMLVAALPSGYVLDPNRGGDHPRQIKVVGNRLAAWWLITDRATRRWFIRALSPEETLKDVVAELQDHVRDDQPLNDPPPRAEEVARWLGFRSPDSLPDEVRRQNEPLWIRPPGAARDELVRQCLTVARAALVNELDEVRRRQLAELLGFADSALRSWGVPAPEREGIRAPWITGLAEATNSTELIRALTFRHP